MSRFAGGQRGNWGSRDVRSSTRETASLYVAGRDCGRIIGRGGSKIRELQDTSEARIKVSRDDEPDGTRKVEISGSKASVEEARRLIEDLVGLGDDWNNTRKTRDDWNTKRNTHDDDDDWNDTRNSGHNGNTKRNTRDDADDWNNTPNSRDDADDRNNTPNTQDDDDVEDWTDTRDDADDGGRSDRGSKSKDRNNGYENGDDGGFGRRDGGGFGRQDSGNFGRRDGGGFDRRDGGGSFDRRDGGGGFGRRDGGGFDRRDGGGGLDRRDGGGGFGRRDGGGGFDRRDGGGGFGRRGGGFGRRDDGGFGRRQQNRDSDNRSDSKADSDPKDVIYVASNDVGRIIGRGGSRIKEIQEESDCMIKVSSDEGEFGEVAVTLIGEQECIMKAKKLIFKTGVHFSSNEPEAEDTAPKERVPINWKALHQNYEESLKKRYAGLPVIKKEFYIEEDHIKDLHPETVRQFRLENNNIMVQNPDCPDMKIPKPVPTFKDCFRNYPEILEQIEKQGFSKPSPIQCQAWPILMSGLDLIGIAQTGTGKTLAFLLPAMIHIDYQAVPRSKRKGPSMLVLCPTRELALQIQEEVEKFDYKGIKSVCVYGGGSRRDQVKAVKAGVEIIVATPGRLNDLINSEIIDLIDVTYLVLDEADRMLDMGFEPDIRKCLLDIRPDRQTAMTSATWPLDVQSLAKRYMTNPVHVQVGTMDLAAVHSVRQDVVFMEDYEKKEYLMDFLYNMQPEDKVIVFVGKKAMVDDISSDLTLKQVSCQSIHGDREQCDRIQALDDFKAGEVRILIATDVASRGLDVKDITHVLNYDFPRNIEEYVHRIGRTGRAGRSGEAITFLTRGDWTSAQKLIDIMAEANQEIPQELQDMAERYKARKERDEREGRRGGRGGRGRFGGRGGRGERDDFFF